MATEHVLIKHAAHYEFFHQSFFDYAFARRFFARGYKLMEWLQSDEQHLFRRSQVRLILIYGRGRGHVFQSSYINDLQTLLNSPTVRFHIKQIVFALLREVSNPMKAEWEILCPIIKENSSRLSQWAWSVIVGSVPWFLLLDRDLGVVKTWLAHEEAVLNEKAFNLLLNVVKQLPDRVVELVEPYIGASKAWNDILINLVRVGDLGISRKFFEFFLQLIDTGVLDNAQSHARVSNSDFWSFFFSLYKEHPELTCEAIRHYLERKLYLSHAADIPDPFTNNFIPDSQSSNQIILECARRSPETFISEILPFMLKVIASTYDRQDSSGILYDSVWHYRSYREEYDTMPTMNVSEDLLTGMETAMKVLSTESAEKFRLIARPLHEFHSETIHYLLIQAYTANGQEFADEAIEFLHLLPARLKTGYVFPQEESAPYWATRQLIKATTPYCSDESLKKLEEAILNYYSDWERDAAGHRERGFGQFVLLEGIVPSRRSSAVSQRLEEWRRKFKIETLPPLSPQPFMLNAITSPIPQQAATKMTDEQWLKAVVKYDYEEFKVKGNKLIGGARELYQVLKNEANNAPERFANLALNFPNDVNPYYFDAVLWGVADTDIKPDMVIKLCLRCHQLPSQPCGRSICHLISKFDDFPFSEEVVEMISWYAIEDEDPKQDIDGDLLNHGINSTRGSAAEAIASLVFSDSLYFSPFLPTIEKMVRDSTVSVRTCTIDVLIAVMKYDKDAAVRLFRKLCKTGLIASILFPQNQQSVSNIKGFLQPYVNNWKTYTQRKDLILKTPLAERFLYYALPTHIHKLSGTLKRMLSSPIPEVSLIASRRICFLSLTTEKVRSLAQRCLSGTDNQRLGVAQIFSSNLLSARFRSYCEESLVQLFNDPNKDVQIEAASCFQDFKNDQLTEYTHLVEEFVQSEAFKTEPHFLVNALKATTADLPEITCVICERFIEAVESTSSNTARQPIDNQTLSLLTMRLYGQTTKIELQTRCLNIIDRMLYMGIHGIFERLSDYER